MTEKRFGFWDNMIWHGTYLIIILAIIDNMVYNFPKSWLGGYWYFLAVICSLGSILHFLRRFNGWHQWTFWDLFKK